MRSAERPRAGGGALASMRLLFRTALLTDRYGLLMGMGMLVLSALLRPLYPLLFKVLIDAGTERPSDLRTATWAAVAIAVVSAGSAAAGSYSSIFLWNVWERITNTTIDEQLVGLAGRIAYVDDVEHDEYLEHLTILRNNRQTFQESVMAMLSALGLAISIAITVVILAGVAPLLLLLPLIGLAPVAASRWAETRSQAAMARTAAETRMADSFMRLAMEIPQAGELRVLGMHDFVLARHRYGWRTSGAAQWRAETTGALVSAAALALFTVAFAGSLLFITVQTVHGDASLGTVILVLTAGQQLHTQIGSAVSTSGALFRVLETMRHYGWIAAYTRGRDDAAQAPAPPSVGRAIELEGVSFAYDGADRAAVSDVSLVLPAGSVVAVVGDNGAGKSTLVSLLCGLHRPTQGRLLVDGKDIGTIALDAWRGSLSAAFQDFVRYQVLARESVGVGDVSAIDDVDHIRRSMRRAGVIDLEQELPEGLETPLGRAFLRGIDLSGGQWQKVVLARSMMREAPLVLALDEPTYSLDVESEQRVFDWFSQVASTDNPAGTVTVIVSHRFSTVRSAHIVAVMHEGRVVESGTHDELLGRGGRYATMYRTQAEGYRT
jgi:ATP-binding cassette subfamily B protein